LTDRLARGKFLQDGKLPFTNVSTVETITHALEKIDACWEDRIYTPVASQIRADSSGETYRKFMNRSFQSQSVSSQ